MTDYCNEMGKPPLWIPCELADIDCPRCHGDGQYPVADGPDDFIMVRCGCKEEE